MLQIEDSKEKRRLIYTTNPNKIRIVKALIRYHIANNHKILVFCDNLFGLNFYYTWLNRPKIDGNTETLTRQNILESFRKRKGGDCILLSTVGDQSIDLPEADVVIQLALIHGSRMQEGQRIGRIQRPQQNKPKAYFYSLVSNDTEEVAYAEKRRQFLYDHGYTITIKSDWEEYVSNVPTIEVVKQEQLVEEIENELVRRQNKKTEGKKVIEKTKKAPKPIHTSASFLKKVKRLSNQ